MKKGNPSRRAVLKAGVAAVASIGMPFVRPAAAAERSLKVAAYGGYFEDNFKANLYLEFEKATGIKVESMPEPGGTGILIQIMEATRSGVVPMDLCTTDQEEVVHGASQKLWRPFDINRLTNLHFLDKRFIHEGPAGIDAVGAMAWYQTMIMNPSAIHPLPTSWKFLWDPGHQNSWGLASGGESTLFEITATTWFGGNAILETKEGILQVLAKIAELKPNVKVWWESEGTMQTAYENDEVVGGMYFNDVAHTMARNGTPVESIFPAEGGVIDFGSWCQPITSTKIDEAHEFINFMCTPQAQAMMTRKVGTAPLVDRRLTDLTDAEFAVASSNGEPIPIAVSARTKLLYFMNAQFITMLTG